MIRIALMAVTVSVLSGCSTHHFNRSADVTSASLVTDAKQRVILSLPRTQDPASRRIVCAEPSPDVAQAISDAIKAGLAVDLSAATGGDSKGKTVSADFGRSSAASVAQLGERLAVVQLLRDRMYRACEAYANGAIQEAAYTLLMARNDKTMMSLLSNELAAGAFGRSLASAGGSSSISGPSQEALAAQQKAVKKASDELIAASTSDPPKKDEAAKAAKSLEDEVAKLAALERQTAAAAAGVPPALGSISNSANRDSLTIGEVHRNYLDDDGVDPLVDACIIGVERLNNESPIARAYLKSVTDRAEKAFAQASDISARLDGLRSRINSGQNALASLSQKHAETMRVMPPGQGKELELGRMRIEMSDLGSRLEADRDYFKDLQEERNVLLKTPGLEIKDLYLASQSPFAAFCFETVLTGDNKFMFARMKQKRQLRGTSVDSTAIASKQLDLCLHVAKADKATIDDKTRASMLAHCADFLRRPVESDDN